MTTSLSKYSMTTALRKLIVKTLLTTTILCAAALAAPGLPAAADILIADFEGENYGQWKTTGEAFGPGPARGTLPGQQPVTGFNGKGLVNSYFKGDGTTGTLTSPPFKIEREFISFLIGGGMDPEMTCMDLLIDGKLVRTATNVKSGGSEALTTESWDVSEFVGKTAVIRIVDQAKGSWGHINVDHIVQTDRKPEGADATAKREFNIEKPYLNLPVKAGAPRRVVATFVDGRIETKHTFELADEPEWWLPLEVSAWRGKTLTLIVSGLPGNSKALELVEQSDSIKHTADAYPDWQMGPFVKHPKPVLSPTPGSRFQCPILGKEVRWEEQNVYNPAAVVRNGKVYLLYRADDKNPGLKWGRTCRIGLAYSEDGINFTRHPTPVLYPDNDPWKQYEWEGGCEDLHIVEGEDGAYYMNYTTWNGGGDTMSVATSRDLYTWTKHGPAFRKATPGNVGGRSGVVVSRLEGNRLIATKVNGKYWMYYTHPCALAWSDNLIDWTRADKSVWPGNHESGAIALLRDEGILVMFNTQGWKKPLPYQGGTWTLGQALIDRNDLTTVLKHPDQPFLYPELDWEKRGFTDFTTVANTVVPFKGRWLLYYGAADRHIGLAVFTPKANSPFSLVK